MRTPTFYDGQFVSAASENEAFSAVSAGESDMLTALFTPGVSGTEKATFTLSGLTVTCDLAGVTILFGTGVLALPLGTSDGAVSSTYTVDVSDQVPSSGTSTVYLVATPVSVGSSSAIITGPPPGNPDYDPTFSPYSAYLLYRDSFALSATTTAPSGAAIEIGRFSISQGATSLGTFDITQAARIGVSDVTEWSSAQIVNARTLTSKLSGYLTQAQSDTRYVRNNAGTNGGVSALDLDSDGTGRLAYLSSGSVWRVVQPAGDYATNTALATTTATADAAVSATYSMGTGDSRGLALFYSSGSGGPFFVSTPWTGQLAKQTDLNTVATTASNATTAAASAQSAANTAQNTANAAVNGGSSGNGIKRGESLYLADNGNPSFGYDGGSVQLALLSQIVSNPVQAESANQRIETGTSASAAAGSFISFKKAFSDLPVVIVQNNGGGEDNVHAYNVDTNGFYLEINGGGSSGIQYIAIGTN